MRFHFKKWLTLLSLYSPFVLAQSLELSPQRPLSLEQVAEVATSQTMLTLDKQSWDNIQQGYAVVLAAALNHQPVYGLTVGVGWNKDKPVFNEQGGKKVLSEELIQLSKQFNLASLKAHAAGLGEPLPIETVRAAMLIRLNTMLKGETGVQPAVAQRYLDFLNHQITPVVPSRGSVGEADITLASHIGLAMIGEGEVFYQGKIQPADSVLRQRNLEPLSPVGKDFLSILSNNSLAAAEAVFISRQSEAQYRKQLALFALMLEGYNGNVAPFSEAAVNARPFPEVQTAASAIRQQLAGSYLWQPSEKRALQDPLSFRTMAYTLGSVASNIEALKQALAVQINSSDDNPLVLIQAPATNEPQLQRYAIDEGKLGAIYPTANFNFLPIASRLDYLNQSLAKLAEVNTQQLIRLENPDFTQLPRFLAAEQNNGHAFGAIQKPFVETNQRIKQLAQPVVFSGVTLAGNIEDTATMSGIALANSRAILAGLDEIAAFQLLHATQALDLRKPDPLSESSQKLWQAYRQEVGFIAQDQAYTPLLQKSLHFWQGYQID